MVGWWVPHNQCYFCLVFFFFIKNLPTWIVHTPVSFVKKKKLTSVLLKNVGKFFFCTKLLAFFNNMRVIFFFLTKLTSVYTIHTGKFFFFFTKLTGVCTVHACNFFFSSKLTSVNSDAGKFLNNKKIWTKVIMII